jgi:hypothetical protein
VLQRLSDLQSSSHLSLSLCANILRYWTARLWLGQIPEAETIPDGEHQDASPQRNADRPGEYPQWKLIENGKPLFSSPEQANQRIQAIETALQNLLSAMAIDPDIVEETAFRTRYTALIAQWTEQGRAYSEYLTREIISTIHQRENQHSLNRGLTIHLPYFDDQLFEIRYFDLEIVPAGRIAFQEVFLIQAVQKAKQRVMDDAKISLTTRQHLMSELELLENSFSDYAPYLPIGALSPHYRWVKVPAGENNQQVPSSLETEKIRAQASEPDRVKTINKYLHP